MDWDDQPNPFRRFEGCDAIALPKPGRELELTWSTLNNQGPVSPASLNMDNIGLLFELAFGLSAWKEYGPDRWALRCNPSSGNLHPSEAYLINGVGDLMGPGVYHYISHDHSLEKRCTFSNEGLADALLLGLSSIHWREAWKYGERAFRYCQLDAGHALAALSYAASVLGWRIELLGQWTDPEVAALLGIDRKDDFIKKEAESPDWICRIHYNHAAVDTEYERNALLEASSKAIWQGKARSLDAYHMYHWTVIDEVSESAQKIGRPTDSWQSDAINIYESTCSTLATQLIRQRRSAQHFNKNSAPIGLEQFQRILSSLLPGSQTPFSSWNSSPAVHLCLFVHKVEGLEPGLYCWPRSEQGLAKLRASLSAEFVWQETEAIPGLYLLHQGDTRQAAKTLSCHQAIASDSAFSLAMLVEFELIDVDAWHYRRLFWECGMLGQILYLEAEAAGLRGTGIGCFFDDAVHGVLGIQDDSLQSFYHFTVGESLEDARIQTLPAYAHLDK